MSKLLLQRKVPRCTRWEELFLLFYWNFTHFSIEKHHSIQPSRKSYYFAFLRGSGIFKGHFWKTFVPPCAKVKKIASPSALICCHTYGWSKLNICCCRCVRCGPHSFNPSGSPPQHTVWPKIWSTHYISWNICHCILQFNISYCYVCDLLGRSETKMQHHVYSLSYRTPVDR